MGNISQKLKYVVMTWVLMLSGCGAARSLIGPATGTVATLWPDVPAFAAATKADLGLPVPVQLLLQSVTGGRFDVIAFTTPRPPPEIVAFYSVDRMKTLGWAANSTGCIGDKNSPDGGICVFSRKEGVKDITLAIVISKDDPPSRNTSIYYARADTTLALATPKP